MSRGGTEHGTLVPTLLMQEGVQVCTGVGIQVQGIHTCVSGRAA